MLTLRLMETLKVISPNHIKMLYRNPIRNNVCAAYNYCTQKSPNDFVNVSQNDGIRHITLVHTKTRNSLSYEMMSNLLTAITDKQDDPSMRVIVLSASGPIFSAGHNLKELTFETGVEFHKKVFQKCTELMMAIVESPVPVIAKVNGLVAAAGCQLVATCDIIVCSDKSTFSTPGANFGIFCSTPGIAVGRCVPKSTATRMLFTGMPITAPEALNSGLVSTVVSEDKLDSEVTIMCDAIKAKSRHVIRLGKEFYYKQMSVGIKDAYQLGEDIMVKNINMPDGQEGIASFAQKRKPKWTV